MIDSSPPLRLLEASIRKHLKTRWVGKTLYLFDRVGSTNREARSFLESGTAHGTVVIADQQTHGQGRWGRTWHSPKGLNIYCSVILTRQPPLSCVSWIPLISGLAAAQTLEEIAETPIRLKWPNDLLIDESKIGGILCEALQAGQQKWGLIVGIGLNINSGLQHFPVELQQTATSLTLKCARTFDRHQILSRLFCKLETWYDALYDSECSRLHESYVQYCGSVDRPIQVEYSDGTRLLGTATGIGNQGELLVRPSSSSSIPEPTPGIVAVRAGEVVHVRHPLERSLRANGQDRPSSSGSPSRR